MNKDELKRKIGQDMGLFLREIIPRGINLRQVINKLGQGDFDSARSIASEVLQDAYSPNFFERDTKAVARDLCGTTISYVPSMSAAKSALITSTAAFYEPRSNCEELFSSAPGEIGFFWSSRHGGYGAILIAAHKPDESGVVSLEAGVAESKRMRMTELADYLNAPKIEGSNIANGSSDLWVPRSSLRSQRYTVQEENKGHGWYYTLRKQ